MDRSAEENFTFDEYDLSLVFFFSRLLSFFQALTYTPHLQSSKTTTMLLLLFVVVGGAKGGEKKSCEISIDEQIAKEIHMKW